MDAHPTDQDAIVIGGGFYGATIASYLVKARGMKRVMLIEREDALLKRASRNNQARIHNGYHYPRSFTTAYRSRVNLRKFVLDWPDAVKRDFIKLYAIAGTNSKVTPKQFERFCHEIGARITNAPASLRALFEPRLVSDVYLVDEFAFDYTHLAQWAARELAATGVDVRLDTRVIAVEGDYGGKLNVALQRNNMVRDSLSCRYLFNCTYSGLNHVGGQFTPTQTRLKHEIAEIALVDMPARIRNYGITLMDGPFFSTLPFPSAGLHSLTHVRYTPHFQWLDEPGADPYARLDAYAKQSRADRMLRDAARYVPALSQARHVESLFEVKTVLSKNEIDDGRPILLEKNPHLPGCYSVLGGKLDNIYDVLEKLDAESIAADAQPERGDMGVTYA